MSIGSEGEAHAAIERWFRAAVAAVDPLAAVRAHLDRRGRALLVDDRELPIAGRLFVAAVGKAALAMARGACSVAGDSITGGLILTKDGHLDGEIPSGFETFEAGHPIPDARGVAATERLLARLGELGSDDLVLALISGGGSALLEAPRPGVSLADMATVTGLLLRAGAPIRDLNAVRIPLSRVKGGGLRSAAPHARFATVILSDVLGNDTRVIASGPTVPTDLTGAGALDVLARYCLTDQVPDAVLTALNAAADEQNPDFFAGDAVSIVGDNAAAVSAFRDAARADGIESATVWTAREGEARELANDWVAEVLAAPDDDDLLLGGGEATVTVRGDGTGGRNTEFVLAAALELERRGRPDIVVASLATDGQDATTGVAGAIGSLATLARARGAGVEPVEALERNDSLAVFRAAGGCVETGPTGTNVNDVYVALRLSA
jgi:hydroxypyruvate reductase